MMTPLDLNDLGVQVIAERTETRLIESEMRMKFHSNQEPLIGKIKRFFNTLLNGNRG